MDVFSSVLSPSRRVRVGNQVVLNSDRLRLPLLSFPCELTLFVCQVWFVCFSLCVAPRVDDWD